MLSAIFLLILYSGGFVTVTTAVIAWLAVQMGTVVLAYAIAKVLKKEEGK